LLFAVKERIKEPVIFHRTISYTALSGQKAKTHELLFKE